ncbi:MAG: HD-GYP domain-containing protein [Planctomycetota bacterium]
MSFRLPTPPRSIPPGLLNRCEQLGLEVWILDDRGHPLLEPSGNATFPLLLRSSAFRAAVGAAAEAFASPEPHGVVEAMPGFRLLPIECDQDNAPTSRLVVLAVGPEALEGEELERLARSAGVEPAVARHVLRERARIGSDEADRLLQQLTWLAAGLNENRELGESLDNCAAQLGDAYEAITTLYAIGRMMGTVSEPRAFLSEFLDKIHETLPFRWTAAALGDAAAFSDDLVGVTMRVVYEPMRAQVDASIPALVEHIDAKDDQAIHVVPAGEALPDELGPQAVVVPIRRGTRRYGYLVAGSKASSDVQVSTYETLLLESAAGYLAAFLHNAQLFDEQQQAFLGTINAMSAAIDAKDRYTSGHSERVAMLAHRLALAHGLDEDEAERVRLSGLVHDVGKIGVPEAVLCKPSRLTDDEFDLIKEHPRRGYEILRGVPSLRDLFPGVLHHHERWDGRGYPDGLSGTSIPLMARLLAIADTFDAMSSTRSYRSALARERVLEEITSNGGAQFDPRLAPLINEIDLSEYDRMVEQHRAAETTFRRDAA